MADGYSELYKLEFDYRSKYLFARVFGGTDSYLISQEYWLRVLNESDRHNYSKVLIEENLNGQLSFSESFELATWLADQKFSNKTIGFVDLHANHDDLNRLGELIATNRGVRGSIFARTEDAVEWLLKI